MGKTIGTRKRENQRIYRNKYTLTEEILNRLLVDPDKELKTKSLTTNKDRLTTQSNTIPKTITTTPREETHESKDEEEINTQDDKDMTHKSITNEYTNDDPECNKNKENTEDKDNKYSKNKEDEERNTKDKYNMQENTNDKTLTKTNTTNRDILIQKHQPIPQFNHSQTNTPTSIKDQTKEKDTLTTHTSDLNSIESDENNTRYIHVNVDIHHRDDQNRPFTPLTEENVNDMIRETTVTNALIKRYTFRGWSLVIICIANESGSNETPVFKSAFKHNTFVL